MNTIIFIYILIGFLVSIKFWWTAMFEEGELSSYSAGMMLVSFSLIFWPLLLYLDYEIRNL